MNELIFKLTPVQLALVQELLKPYVDLSLSLSAQYKGQSQINQQSNKNAANPAKTARAEKIKKED